MTPTVYDHAFAAVLRDPKGLRKVGRKDTDRVNPGSAPEVSRRIRPPEPQVRRSVPAEIVKRDRPVRGCAVRTNKESDRLDWLSARVGQTPCENRLRAGRKSDWLAVERRQGVVAAIHKRTQGDADAAG